MSSIWRIVLNVKTPDEKLAFVVVELDKRYPNALDEALRRCGEEIRKLIR